MKWSLANRQTRFYLLTALVLLMGLGAATAVYLAAERDSQSNPMAEFEQSKVYRHDLEVYGGTMNVLTDEWLHWWDSLWHGKSLAFTIAGMTLPLALGFFLAARSASRKEREQIQNFPWN